MYTKVRYYQTHLALQMIKLSGKSFCSLSIWIRWFPMRCVRIGLEFVFIRCEFGFTQMLFVESKLETEKQIQSSRYGTTILIESTRRKKYVSLAIYDNHVSYINIGVPFVLFEQHLTEHAAALCFALFFTALNVKAEKNLFIHLICKRITIIYSVVHTAKMFFLCIFMHVMHASCAIHSCALYSTPLLYQFTTWLRCVSIFAYLIREEAKRDPNPRIR